MPQQINLCTPILLTQKRYFSAQTMVQALTVFVVLGGALCGYWVWSLNAASDGFKNSLATQSRELESLQAAIQRGKVGSAPQQALLAQELQSRKTELQQREQLAQELQRGLLRPGWGHAARLQLVAQSIPAAVWLTGLKADDQQLVLSGYTLEPSALNDWVSKLASSPLLAGQKLTTIKVESTNAAAGKALVGSAVALPAASSAIRGVPRATWSFSLVSAVAKPVVAAGGKP